MPGWHARSKKSPPGLARFMAMQPAGFARAAAALRGGRELTRASALLEEPAVRLFLRRAQEMRREGFTPRRLFTEADGLGAGGVAVERMLEAGLLEREVRVSCRKSGHALFDLPSPDSLAAITISRAKCSLCAAPVADEVIEETINPTRLAVALLEDGRWLTNRVYKIIRALGIPDSEIATAPASTHGESQLAVDVCGNSFLFVTRDGDLTPAFCRRIVETVEETGGDAPRRRHHGRGRRGRPPPALRICVAARTRRTGLEHDAHRRSEQRACRDRTLFHGGCPTRVVAEPVHARRGARFQRGRFRARLVQTDESLRRKKPRDDANRARKHRRAAIR